MIKNRCGLLASIGALKLKLPFASKVFVAIGSQEPKGKVTFVEVRI